MSQIKTVANPPLLSTTASLAAQGICQSFHDGFKQREVLKDVNLSIWPGQFSALVGPSGSGKTTLLNILGAMERPTRGKVVIDGEDITAVPEKELARVRNRKIGMVFQFFHLLDQISVLSNVELPMRLARAPRRQITARAMELLEHVGLESMVARTPMNLSGGEKQRVAIVRALANSPSIVLADEPTGNLDGKNSNEIIDLMIRLTTSTGSSLLVATHNQEIAARADEIYELKEGSLARQ